MDQLDHVKSVIAITVCKVIQKIITNMNNQYHTEVNKREEKVYLVP